MKQTDNFVQEQKTITLTYYALQKTSGGSFRGGLIPPKIDGDIKMKIWHEDQIQAVEGEWHSKHFTGSLQVEITGSRKAYEALGQFFLSLAALNIDVCPDYHSHNELMSEDGEAKLHLIFRRSETKD